MFKVLTYAYMNNIYSSRKIEAACKRDINFMWLLEGQSSPDHSTIARFRKDYLAKVIEDVKIWDTMQKKMNTLVIMGSS